MVLIRGASEHVFVEKLEKKYLVDTLWGMKCQILFIYLFEKNKNHIPWFCLLTFRIRRANSASQIHLFLQLTSMQDFIKIKKKKLDYI